jgi:hypothetical protein
LKGSLPRWMSTTWLTLSRSVKTATSTLTAIEGGV